MTIDLRINANVFNPIYIPFLDSDIRTQLYFGGSSSGKSVFLAQRTVIDIVQGGRNYLVVRNVAGTIKKSVFNEIVKAITQFKLLPYFKINNSDLEITCVNGYQILFSGLDDVEKIKSITPKMGVVTDVWVEEATEISKTDYLQLTKRLRGLSFGKKKRIILSFNPVLRSHWIYTDFFDIWDETKQYCHNEGVSILKTTYKDNKFLAPDDIAALENEPDEYFREVYTYGNWGILGDVIFKNWMMKNFDDLDLGVDDWRKQMTNRRHGLDFGFASDPAALICTHYDRKRKTIYVYNELYATELTNDILAEEVKDRIERDDVVTCDSAEPKSIAELKQYRVNAKGAKKGKGSINHGIQWLKQQNIIIDIRCQNFKNEIQAYQWKTDKNDVAISVPVGKNNHLMDALRYAYEDEYVDKTGPVTVKL